MPAVRAALRSLPFERVLAACIALTIFAFVCGSSSVPEVDRFGNKARWAMLLVLLVVAAGAAWRDAPRRVPRPAAAAGWLLVLAVVSIAWSVDPRLTFERAGAFALVVVAAALAAAACARHAERALAGVLGGAVLVAFGGLVLLAVDRHWALKRGSTGVPTHFRGLGVDVNTASLLYGVVLPIAVFAFLRARSTPQRVAAAAAFLLLDGSIVGSGSRAPLVGGFAAALLVAALAPTRRLVTAGALAVLLGLSIGLGTIPKPLSTNLPPKKPAFVQPTPKPGYANAEVVFPLEDDVGRSLPGQGSRRGSARSPARAAASPRGRARCTRPRCVRWPGTASARRGTSSSTATPTSSGACPRTRTSALLLELGVVGLISFVAVFVLWLVTGWRAWRVATADRRLVLAASGAALASGLVMAFVQSYFYSAGNVATLSFWLCGFLLVGVARAYGCSSSTSTTGPGSRRPRTCSRSCARSSPRSSTSPSSPASSRSRTPARDARRSTA